MGVLSIFKLGKRGSPKERKAGAEASGAAPNAGSCCGSVHDSSKPDDKKRRRHGCC